MIEIYSPSVHEICSFHSRNTSSKLDGTQYKYNRNKLVNMSDDYIKPKDLKVYQLSRKVSKIGWKAYNKLDWRDKKIMGDQFIRSVDSVGANIIEGYGRYHYLDKIKFYYNARASLLEAKHWVSLLKERGKVSQKRFNNFKKIFKSLEIKLNNFIKTTYESKESEQE